MPNVLRSLLVVVAIVFSLIAHADDSASDVLIDTRRPLIIVLNEAERLIRFDGPVAFATRDVSGVYRLTDYLAFQNLDASVLIDPIRKFPPMRVEVMRRDIERRYLIDLRFDEGTSPLIDLTITDQRALEQLAADKPDHSSTIDTPTCLSADCIADPRALLIRYAAQRLYGPEALVTPLPGITSRVPPTTAFFVMYADEALLTPIRRWHWRGYRLDALQIENNTDETITLDPRKLRGLVPDAVVSAQRWSLNPAKQPGRSTTLYLVQPERQ